MFCVTEGFDLPVPPNSEYNQKNMDANVESQSESETRVPAAEKTAAAKSPSDASAASQNANNNNNNNAFKPSKKLVRVLTVFGYVISVSLAGVMLSLYYVFLWKPTVNNVRPDARVALIGDGIQMQPLAMTSTNRLVFVDDAARFGENFVIDYCV
jgi:hypothetical protein